VVINPATPAVVLQEVLREVNLVLVMTIDPGFGNQHCLHMTRPKIRQVRRMIEQINPNCESELDGGIDTTTVRLGVALEQTCWWLGPQSFIMMMEWLPV
jgi:ribulose-phosphate 3-epimerase